MKKGAADYLMKDRLARLGPAVKQVLERKQAEETIRELARFPSENPSPVLRFERSGKMLYANQAAIIQSADWNLEPGSPAPKVLNDYIEEVFQAGNGKTVEINCGESVFLVAIESTPGEKDVNLYGRDITARKLAEEALGESEERYRTLAEASPDLIYVIGRDDSVQYINDFAARQFGMTPEQVIGKPRTAFFPPVMAEQQEKYMRPVFESGHSISYDILLPFGKREMWVNSSLVPLRDESGVVTSVMGISRDISKRKQAEEKLRESEKKWHDIFEILPVGVSIVDSKHEVMDANAALSQILDLSKEDLLKGKFSGRKYLRADKTLMPAEEFPSLRAITEQRIIHDIEIGVEKEDGTIIWTNVSATPLSFGSGSATVTTDITGRKQAEEALRASQRNYQTLTEVSTVGIFHTDVRRKTTYVNPRWCEISGLPAEEAPGDGWQRAVHPDDRKPLIAGWGEAVREQKASISEYRFLRPDGTVRWVMGRATPETSLDGKIVGYVGTITDITERKQAEEKLSASENELCALFAAMTDVVLVLDADGRYLRIAPTNPINLYLPPADMLGKTVYEVLPKEQADFMIAKIGEAIQTNQIVPGEYALQINDQEIWFAGSVSRLSENTAIWVAHDITERKRAEEKIQQVNVLLEQRVEERTRELREAQEKLVRKERLAVLGELAGSVSHELRNPLGIISGGVYYLDLVQPEADEKVKKYHAMIAQETRNAEKIITDLLDFARVSGTERKALLVPELMQGVLVRFPVPPSVKVTLQLPDKMPMIFADPRQLEQVLGNLVINACQAMPEGGTLTISARQQKESIAITVKDTGSGITPENMLKLFEPLFTTKASGIGLGLAVSRKLAEANGGSLEVQSKVGKGSTFTLFLPKEGKKP
jgi:PAS domain S-box-containing protein